MIRLKKLIGKVSRYLQLSTSYYIQGIVPVLVYSAERTGCVILHQSLVTSGVHSIVTHGLRRDSPDRLSGSAKWALETLLEARNPPKIFVISLIRNPLENIVSIFARETALAGDRALMNAERFVGNFIRQRRYSPALDWFDVEFNAALGIDVYCHGFDKQAGFSVINVGRFAILILRTELSDLRKEEIVGNFLALDKFKMLPKGDVPRTRSRIPAGTPGNTAYGEAYARLRQELSIPDPYLQEILQSKFCTHFFTVEELLESRTKGAGRQRL